MKLIWKEEQKWYVHPLLVVSSSMAVFLLTVLFCTIVFGGSSPTEYLVP